MDMGNLYVKLRVTVYKGENVENIAKIKKEILYCYNKLYDEYVIDRILPPVDWCFYQIGKHYRT
jgi:hypothetical protein